jgi:hypothetical protein
MEGVGGGGVGALASAGGSALADCGAALLASVP